VARGLKKQWQSLGIAAEERTGPLVYDGAGALLFVPGLGVDARAWAPAGAPQWGLRWLPAAPADESGVVPPSSAAKARPV